jgi:hypothetical protein
MESSETKMVWLCSGCYAEVAASHGFAACPVCGGALVARANLDSAEMPPRQEDHRGILLPRRHAVGGVITPR